MMMRFLLLLFFGLSVLASALPAQAQDGNMTVPGILYGSPDSYAEFHGFVVLEFYDFQKDGETVGYSPINTFDPHNFYLSARAKIASDLTVFGEIEHEHGAIIKVDRALIDWELAKFLTLRIGRFYVPISYERTHYWAPARMMTSRPFLVDIPFHEWADTGIEAVGRVGLLGYDLSVVNGPRALTENGIPITDVQDNNNNKAVVGRLNFFPASFIESGAAYAAGRYEDYDPTGTAPKLAFRIYELDARIHPGRLDVWMEYDRRFGDDEPCNFATDATCNPDFTGDPAGKVGYYALVAYNIIQNEKNINYLKPIVRYDKIENVDSKTGNKRVTAGLNWSPKPHFVIKTEYQWTTEFPKTVKQANNGAMVSVVADF
jgi:hypothetical protein